MLRLSVLAMRSHSFAFMGRMSSSEPSGVLQYFAKHGIHDKAFVNGAWVGSKSNKTFEVYNSTPDAVVPSVPDMSESNAEDAIQAAHTAFKTWKDTTGKERSQLLRSWCNFVVAKQKEMANVLTLENGKPIKEAPGEILYNDDNLELEDAKRLHRSLPTAMFLIRQRAGSASALAMNPNHSSLTNAGICSTLGGVRSLIQYSMQKGKRKTVHAVIRRFFRLHWGAWIRPRAGRHRKVWRKNNAMRKRALQHVFTNTTQSHMLDKMVCKFWREKKFYVDDPYESYHKRDNFHVTRRWPI